MTGADRRAAGKSPEEAEAGSAQITETVLKARLRQSGGRTARKPPSLADVPSAGCPSLPGPRPLQAQPRPPPGARAERLLAQARARLARPPPGRRGGSGQQRRLRRRRTRGKPRRGAAAEHVPLAPPTCLPLLLLALAQSLLPQCQPQEQAAPPSAAPQQPPARTASEAYRRRELFRQRARYFGRMAAIILAACAPFAVLTPLVAPYRRGHPHTAPHSPPPSRSACGPRSPVPALASHRRDPPSRPAPPAYPPPSRRRFSLLAPWNPAMPAQWQRATCTVAASDVESRWASFCARPGPTRAPPAQRRLPARAGNPPAARSSSPLRRPPLHLDPAAADSANSYRVFRSRFTVSYTATGAAAGGAGQQRQWVNASAFRYKRAAAGGGWTGYRRAHRAAPAR